MCQKFQVGLVYWCFLIIKSAAKIARYLGALVIFKPISSLKRSTEYFKEISLIQAQAIRPECYYDLCLIWALEMSIYY